MQDPDAAAGFQGKRLFNAAKLSWAYCEPSTRVKIALASSPAPLLGQPARTFGNRQQIARGRSTTAGCPSRHPSPAAPGRSNPSCLSGKIDFDGRDVEFPPCPGIRPPLGCRAFVCRRESVDKLGDLGRGWPQGSRAPQKVATKDGDSGPSPVATSGRRSADSTRSDIRPRPSVQHGARRHEKLFDLPARRFRELYCLNTSLQTRHPGLCRVGRRARRPACRSVGDP